MPYWSAQTVSSSVYNVTGLQADERLSCKPAPADGMAVFTVEFEILYRLHYSPPPTARELAMEEYLLECD
jgi:hypothetical protein